MPYTPKNDDDLLAKIAEFQRIAEAPNLKSTKRFNELNAEIQDTIPSTLAGVLALLEFSDFESDEAQLSAVKGLRDIVAKCALQEPPVLPPNASVLQKLIVVEWRIRSMSVKISDSADDLKSWLRDQDEGIKQLAANIDFAEVYGLYDRINEKANVLLDQIRTTPPITSLADAITLLETDDPPLDAVITGLRAIAEKGGAA